MTGQKSKIEAKLRVGDLVQREDYGTGIARIDADKMKELVIEEGDVLEIRGKRQTSAVCFLAYQSDIGTDIIRIDGITRRNCDSNIGDYVIARKVKAKDAKKITLAVTRKGLTIHLTSDDLNKALIMRSMKAGDIIIPNPIVRKDGENFQELMGADISKAFFSSSFEEKFAVVSTAPDGIVRVVDSTAIELITEPYIAITELDEPYQARVINVKKCPDLKSYIELKGIEDIKKFINAGNLVSRYEDENSIIYFISSYFFKIHKTAS